MKNFLPAKLQSAAAVAVLKAGQQSPQILFGAGVAGVIGTVVLASRATLRLESVLDEVTEKSEQMKQVALEHPDKYTAQDQIRDKALLRVQTALKIGKLYLPAIVLGSLSIAALGGSHRILTTRNAALSAAYAAVNNGFKQYRGRVVEEFGEEQDRKLLFGVQKENVVETDANGKKTVKKKEIATGSVSGYGVLFHEGNPNWNRTAEFNVIFLRVQQNIMNELLNRKGFVLLNDVYDALGFERTSAGAVVGWVAKDRGGKDGYIDFGIWDPQDASRVLDYMNGREGEIHLDFNVDGEVAKLIDQIV